MTRDGIPTSNAESPVYSRQLLEREEMQVLAAWLDMRQLLWCHVPNESRAPVQYRVRMAKSGLKSGVPDVLIFQPPANRRREDLCREMQGPVGCALELKAGRGKASPAQKVWLDALAQRGWLCSVQVGASAAIDWLRSLGY